MSVSKTKNTIKNFSNQPFDFVLLIVVFIMLALGLIMVMWLEAKDLDART